MKKEYYNGNKQEFWKTDLDYPFILYPMNEQIRHQAEKQLGVTSPESFIDLYNKQNRGDLAYSYFMLPDEGEGWVTSFDPIHFENDDESLFTEKRPLTHLLFILWKIMSNMTSHGNT